MFKRFNRKSSKVVAEAETETTEPIIDFRDFFILYSGGESYMTKEQLLRFLVEQQGQKESEAAEEAEKIMKELIMHRKEKEKAKEKEKEMEIEKEKEKEKERDRPSVDDHRMGICLDEFLHFLLSVDLNGPIHHEVHHDMTAPLSHYFIYTGHNSYLTGNQLSSDCSDAPIIRALQRGVRVIELDLWPNSSKDDILVLHGRTLTSPVTLIKCLKSIELYAFVKSPYPVIITLEDHLTPELQAKVAEMVTQTFGDMLHYPEGEGLMEFPSPDSLKHKIIISTKPPKEYLGDSKHSKDKEKGSLSIFDSSDEEKESLLVPDIKINGDRACDKTCEKLCSKTTKPDRKGPEYKRLITIQAGKPKGSLKDALKAVEDSVRRMSLSEQELEKAAATHSTDVVRFTQRNILRIYPKGTRVTSSNYKPTIGWMHGAQMVAFNMQGYGRPLWMMQGMFRANGGCGYVKKPEFLMVRGPNKEVFDPKETHLVRNTLKVKVIMGDGWSSDFSQNHFDKHSPPDFYTKVFIVGVPADEAKKKTRIIEDEWFPVWNEEFTFPLTVPELALLRIEVREYDRSEKDDFGGQTCLPVLELKSGIRAVPLYDRKGERYKSVRLLMQFQFV